MNNEDYKNSLLRGQELLEKYKTFGIAGVIAHVPELMSLVQDVLKEALKRAA